MLLALDKFKGTLVAHAVVDALAAGIAATAPHLRIDRLPVADGGEGTLELLSAAMGLQQIERIVRGPRGEPVRAAFGEAADGALAVVELARAAGLASVPEGLRDPTRTTTFGVGELIRHAIDRGAQRVVVTLGGSATCDGGGGLAQALGAKFRDRDGALLPQPLRGADLERIASVEAVALSTRDGSPVQLEAAVDVDSPLLGMVGAARRFAAQKGATPAQIDQLERGLTALSRARVVAGGRWPRGDHRSGELRSDAAESRALAELPGSGAAGGCGFGLAAFCAATLRPGAALVLEALRFEAHLGRAALVVTGEGRFDASSMAGKASVAVARAAQGRGVPTLLVAGEVDDDPATRAEVERLFSESISLVERFGRGPAMEQTSRCLHLVGELIGRRGVDGRTR